MSFLSYMFVTHNFRTFTLSIQLFLAKVLIITIEIFIAALSSAYYHKAVISVFPQECR